MFEIKQVTTNRAHIAYRTIGHSEGDPLVLVQGLGMPGMMWADLAKHLAEHGFSVALLDNRGTGDSINHKPFFLMSDLADDVAAVIDAEFDRPAFIAGISLGGMIAQNVAIRHPNKLEGMVLAATTVGLPHNLMNGAFFRPEALALLVRLTLFPSSIKPGDIRRLLAHEDYDENMHEFLGRMRDALGASPTPATTYVRQLIAATLHSSAKHISQFDKPVKVITGDSDFLIPPKNSELIARALPRATVTVVPRAGHIFPVERPEYLPRAIIELREEARA